jgi:hypothetical protein
LFNLYQIRVNYPFFGGDKAEGRRQKAEGKEDLSSKGGYQGGFSITPFPSSNASLLHTSLLSIASVFSVVRQEDDSVKISRIVVSD